MKTLNNNNDHVIQVLESLISTISSMDNKSPETKQIKEAFIQKAFILDYNQRVTLRDTIITHAKFQTGKYKMQAYELAACLYSRKQVQYEIIA